MPESGAPAPPRSRPGSPGSPVAPLPWRAAEVVELVAETARVKDVVLAVPGWPGHLPGQRVDVRLTAEDGYQARRSYSIASPPEDELVVLTVERLADGEVSPYLVDELRPGDRLELRGPIGGSFVWECALGGPLFLAAGGSGVVPLMSMIRHRARSGCGVPARLLYSSRTLADVVYREELARLAGERRGLEVVHTLTRARPLGWAGFSRRVDAALVREVAFAPGEHPLCYVCGPAGFVEAVADALVALGHERERIRTERFGPTGG